MVDTIPSARNVSRPAPADVRGLSRLPSRLLGALVLLFSVACSRSERAPDLILINADIYTVDAARPRAEALAVTSGRISAVGSTDEIAALADSETLIRDAAGNTVVPGLIDGHVHFASGLNLVRGVDLYGIAESEEWLRRIRKKVESLDSGEWVVGGRWDHTLIDPAEYPTRHQLDRIAPDNPVALSDVDGHALWVNSMALRLAGIDASTLDPQGGRILHEPATGEPTGILLEASSIVTEHIPETSREERLSHRRDILRIANRLGITSAHDMASVETLDDYLALLEEGELSVRLWFGTYTDPDRTQALVERQKTLSERVQRVASESGELGPRLVLGYVKMVIDGVLSTRTAAMIEPYADAPLELGLPRLTEEELRTAVLAVNRAGLPVAIHAIGDSGVRMSLNAFEASNEALGRLPLPNRVEHIEVVDPADATRFSRLGVLASMNPHHCITGIDKYNTHRLGVDRAPWSFPWGRLRDSGATLVFGSDWPTAPLDPLQQLYAAVVREKPLAEDGTGGGPEGGWYPENRVTWEQALRAYTLEGARAAGWQEEIGSLRLGKWADFVVLDRRLEEMTPRALFELRVEETFVAGSSVTGKLALDAPITKGPLARRVVE